MKKSILLLFAMLSIATAHAQSKTNPKSQSEELGTVSWYRDYTQAIANAKTQKKPVLILFQEVPGCVTCRNYGHNVLSHPLMVEAIENEFIPLAIYNNKGGADKRILDKYNEPTWNNPVVRIVNTNGDNIVKRVASNYSALGLYNAMQQALEAQGKPLPEYFKILGKELRSAQGNATKDEYYKMYCFWSGEKHLGTAEGVVATESGFMNGYEVVKVSYDATQTQANALTAHAAEASCRPIKNTGDFRVSAKDNHFYLQKSNYKYLPLSDLQKTLINTALGQKQDARKYLSPTQAKWFKQASNNSSQKVLANVSLAKAWAMM